MWRGRELCVESKVEKLEGIETVNARERNTGRRYGPQMRVFGGRSTSERSKKEFNRGESTPKYCGVVRGGGSQRKLT